MFENFRIILSFKYNLKIICIINKIIKLKQVIFKPSISNNNVCKELDEESSTNLLIFECILLSCTLDIFFLLTVVIIEWANPPDIAPAIIIPAFCKGGIEDLAIPLDMALAIPAMEAPNPMLLPIVFKP